MNLRSCAKVLLAGAVLVPLVAARQASNSSMCDAMRARGAACRDGVMLEPSQRYDGGTQSCVDGPGPCGLAY
jgi:hypothetical protein